MLALLSAFTGCAAQRPTLVPIGGSLEVSNAGAFAAMLEGVPASASILIAPFASGEPDESWERARGFFVQHAPFARIERMEDPTLSPESEARALAQLRAAQLVFFTGGDQSRIVPRFANPSLRRALARPTLRIAGTSAGASMMSDPMFIGGGSESALLNLPYEDDDEQTRDASQPARRGARLSKGLGLAPELLIDTHTLQRGRYGRMLAALRTGQHTAALGLADASGAVVTSSARTTTIEVLHNDGAVLCWLDAPPRQQMSEGDGVVGLSADAGARLSLLHAGDRVRIERVSESDHASSMRLARASMGVGSPSRGVGVPSLRSASRERARVLLVPSPRAAGPASQASEREQPAIGEARGDTRDDAWEDGALQALLAKVQQDPTRTWSVQSDALVVRAWADERTRFVLREDGLATAWGVRVAVDARTDASGPAQSTR
jgi:cyanophycinase